ncbi:GNAT family N-acetyltransferase [Leptothrix discophora]|uniref:GNAT family N-acetyltransferase n=1 Tax=Leptothrix discophora TaxID=89 RepID=A0ABT9G409_LEPDI|nr:GNAT family N-acetyltransferase [Leptothrix discophora]MDP4301225.1 GNAT family N-acetyltransferase [Leptothrix discophora]
MSARTGVAGLPFTHEVALMGPDDARLSPDLPPPAEPALTLRVTLAPLRRDDAATMAALAHDWRALHRAARASVFLDWDWMAAWLAMLPAGLSVHVLRAEDLAGGSLTRHGSPACGLALLVPQVRRRWGLPVCTTWHLHATGDATLDALTIEHNDFLVDRHGADAIRAAMRSHWLDATRGPRELSLPGVAESVLADDVAGLDRREQVRETWSVDLDAVRDTDGGYLRLLSSNLRQQVRRSIKAYEAVGKLRLEPAASVEQALDWLDRLAALHQARWTAKGHPGAFANPGFVAFHQRLIRAMWADGRAMVLALRAGEHEAGYLYSLAGHGRVCFYQGGFDYDGPGQSVRPGYVAHALAVALHAKQGHAVYDFLMGEARYKRSMSTDTGALAWRVLTTRDWPLRLEAGLRALKGLKGVQALKAGAMSALGRSRSRRAPHAD